MRKKRNEERKTPKPKAPAAAGNFGISTELLARIRATKIDETELSENVLIEGKLSKDQKELLRLITVKKMIEELKILEEEGRTGDTSAIEALYQIADKSTHLLFRIATEQPELITHLARTVPLWPVHFGPYPLIREALETFASRVELGTATDSPYELRVLLKMSTAPKSVLFWLMTQINRLRGEFQNQQVLARVRAELGEKFVPLFSAVNPFGSSVPNLPPDIVKAAIALPPLSKDSKNEWMDLFKKILKHLFDGHPERDPQLRLIGQYRAKHKKGSPTPATVESEIQSGIFEKLGETLDRFLKKNTA